MQKTYSLLRRLRSYLENTTWIVAERVFHLAFGFVLSVLLARYLGPEQFGVLNYAISLAAIFGVVGHMGLSGLVVREMVQKPNLHAETMGTTFGLKLVGYTLSALAVIAVAFFELKGGKEEFWVLVIVAVSLAVKPFEVIDFWFQANIQAKYTAISKSLGLLVAGVAKISLIWLSATLLLFSVATTVQTVVSAAALLYFFGSKSTIRVSEWTFSRTRAASMLRQGWMIFAGAAFSMIYLKVDQVMLKWMIGAEAVGVYSIAVTFSETWYFIPTAIVASLFPRLIALRRESNERYLMRLQQIFDLLFALAVVVAMGVAVLAKPLIYVFYGEAYREAAAVLVVHIWAAVFVFMRAGLSKWILIENFLMFSFITQAGGAIMNVLLNLILIPKMGILGAAVATLVSYCVASYLSLALFPASRSIFVMMTKSFFCPIRYGINITRLFRPR